MPSSPKAVVTGKVAGEDSDMMVILEKNLRPRDKVFDLAWTPAVDRTDQATLGPKLVKDYHIRPEGVLTSCSTCHR